MVVVGLELGLDWPDGLRTDLKLGQALARPEVD